MGPGPFVGKMAIEAGFIVYEDLFDFIDIAYLKLRMSGRGSSKDTYRSGFKRMYVRMKVVDANGILVPAIVVASVRAVRPGEGLFRKLILDIQSKYPNLAICVECANPRFGRGLLRIGFTELTKEPRSYFLLPGERTHEMTNESIDWSKIEKLMRRAVRGQGVLPTREEQNLLDKARSSDLEQYTELHKMVKGEAITEVNPFG